MGNGKDGCEFGRKLEQRVGSMEKAQKDAVDRIEETVSSLNKEMRGRPTWTATAVLAALSCVVTALATLLAAGF